MTDHPEVNEVIVDLIRRRNGLLEERRGAEPESDEEIYLDGQMRGLREALDRLDDLADWDLPEWAVGVENVKTAEFEWYYPRAVKREGAIREARSQARDDLGDSLNVYQVDGPMPTRADGGFIPSDGERNSRPRNTDTDRGGGG